MSSSRRSPARRTSSSGIASVRQWSLSTWENGGNTDRSTRRSGSHSPERMTAFEHWKYARSTRSTSTDCGARPNSVRSRSSASAGSSAVGP